MDFQIIPTIGHYKLNIKWLRMEALEITKRIYTRLLLALLSIAASIATIRNHYYKRHNATYSAEIIEDLS